MKSKLRYSDEQDRAYGLAGMAIALFVLDGQKYINSISIDVPVGQSIDFSEDFYFVNNPKFSAKIAWNENLKHFQLSAGMILSNIICRNYVRHRHKLSSDVINDLKRIVCEDAASDCSLDKDESDMMFSNSLQYFDRLFSYSTVHEVARDFVDAIGRRRSLSSQEVIENLSRLDGLVMWS